MKRIFKVIAICLIVTSLASCGVSEAERIMNTMKKPIYIASISTDGDVLLYDSKGDVLMLPHDYYMAKSILDSGFKAGDILIPITQIKGKDND